MEIRTTDEIRVDKRDIDYLNMIWGKKWIMVDDVVELIGDIEHRLTNLKIELDMAKRELTSKSKKN